MICIIASPFSLADDGESLCSLIVYPTDKTFKWSDNFQVAMHADSFGIELAKRKIEILNNTMGVEYAQFELSGEITAEGDIIFLQEALLDATKPALILSFNYSK